MNPPTLENRRFRIPWPIWFYLVAFALAEILAAGYNIRLGFALHAVLLLTLLGHAAFSDGPLSKFLVALSLAATVRVLSLTMPLGLVDPVWRYAMVNLPLIVAALVAARMLGYTRFDIGLRLGNPLVQLGIMLLGPVIGAIERLIIQPPPLAESLELGAVLGPSISLILFTGFSEELLFRGLMQKAAIDLMGPWRGILFVGLVFGVFHMGWQSPLDVAFVTVVGIVFGWLVYRTGSILGVALAHGVANVFLFIILPLTGFR